MKLAGVSFCSAKQMLRYSGEMSGITRRGARGCQRHPHGSRGFKGRPLPFSGLGDPSQSNSATQAWGPAQGELGCSMGQVSVGRKAPRTCGDARTRCGTCICRGLLPQPLLPDREDVFRQVLITFLLCLFQASPGNESTHQPIHQSVLQPPEEEMNAVG